MEKWKEAHQTAGRPGDHVGEECPNGHFVMKLSMM